MIRSAFLGVLLAVATAGVSYADDAAKRGGTLRVGFQSDADTMNPVQSIQLAERQVLYLIYNTLVKIETDFSISPELAESWDVENDGKRIVFHLQEGVTFHDGTPFDADAVKWNIDHRLSEEVNSPQRKQLEPVIDNVEVIDEHTVAFNMKQSFPPLLALLAERPGFMVSPTAAQEYGEDFGNNPVGTGPFVFVEWVRGSHLTVERNPDYWEEGLPHLDKVDFLDISGSVVALQRLKTDELDYVDALSPNDTKLVANDEDIQLKPINVGRWYSLQWQWQNPPFNDATLRKAIAHAIDKERIVEIVMNGKAEVSNGPTPSGLWWFDPEIKAPAYDPDEAERLLQEAGYDGEEIVLATPSDSTLTQLNQLIQEQLQAVGLNVKLDPVAQSEWYSRVVEQAINFTPMRWTQRADPDGLLYILFHADGYANSTGYNNPKVNELLEEARRTFDREKRGEMYHEAQEIIVEDLPYVPLFFSSEFAALRAEVHDFVWYPDQIPRFKRVWVDR